MTVSIEMSLVDFVEQIGGFKMQPWQRQIVEEFEKHPNERLELIFTRKMGFQYRWVPK
jgi:hypothetical protein